MAMPKLADTPVQAPRMDLFAASPDSYQAMLTFLVAAGTGLDPGIAALVKVRASVMNGCGFCTKLHESLAQSMGETEERLSALPGWAVASLFTPRECAALALTEAVTILGNGGVPDEVYDRAAQEFDEAELAQLIWTIAAINALNRASIAAGMPSVS